MAIGSDYTKIFADRLSDLIDEKRQEGKSFKEIAIESGVPTGSLSKYQNDAAEAGVNSLVKLAKYFNVSTDYLLGITDISNGDAGDMAIEKRLGLDSHAINVLSKFYKEDESAFLNLLFANDFGDIILDCQKAFNNYIQAKRDEYCTFKKKPAERLIYNIELSDYNPVKLEDDLGFSLTLTAENYYEFCLQQMCTRLNGFLSELASDMMKRINEIEHPNLLEENNVRIIPTKKKRGAKNG